MKKSETSNVVYMIILTSFIILSGSSECKAKAAVYSFEQIIDKSDIVVIGKVTKIRNGIFFEDIAYIELIKIIKGKSAHTELKIIFGNIIFAHKEDMTHLDIGEIYVFFLKDVGTYFRITGCKQGCYHVKNGESVCFDGNHIKIDDFVKKIISK